MKNQRQTIRENRQAAYGRNHENRYYKQIRNLDLFRISSSYHIQIRTKNQIPNHLTPLFGRRDSYL